MIKVLVVCSFNSGKVAPFIKEQVNSLKQFGTSIDYYLIQGKGPVGYLKNYFPLLEKLKQFKPNIIHAHYGYSGLLSLLQRIIPVVCTFHGTDVSLPQNRILSFLVSRLAKENIFVHSSQPRLLKYEKTINLIPCGVDMNRFHPIDRNQARLKLKLDLKKKYILFSSSFNNAIKNYPLAKKAIQILGDNIELIELKNYSRTEVNLLMNSCDALLVTSHSETGPLVVKEAMACNCPVISVDVGNVRELVYGVSNCCIVDPFPEEIAAAIMNIVSIDKRSSGRVKLLQIKDRMEDVARRIIRIYHRIVFPDGKSVKIPFEF